MRRILWALLLCLPLLTWAKGKDDAKYLAGAVPETNGQVVFSQAFAVKGKSQREIYGIMQSFVKQLVDSQIQGERTRIIENNAENGEIVARMEEWMVFKKKPLYLDRTRFRYILAVTCEADKVKMQLSQISYYYREDMEGQNGETYKAEEWISDANALNKAGTKLTLGSAKFRRATIDRVANLFEQARDAFEVPVPERKKATELLNE